VQNTVARNGGYALRVNPTVTGTGYAVVRTHTAAGGHTDASVATSFFRFYFRYATKPASGNEPIALLLDTGAAAKAALHINANGTLAHYNAATVLVATGATVLAADTWYLVEWKVGTGAVSDYELKIDGTSEISGTSTHGISNAGAWRLGKTSNVGGNTVDFFYDDVLWSDSAYPGAGRNVLLLPVANGTYQTWSIGAGAGSHFENVDDVPNDANTTYLLSTLVAGDAETEDVQTRAQAGISVGIINCVKPIVITRSIGGTGTIQLRLRSGSTDTDSTDASPVATYGSRCLLRDTDPATSAAWAAAALDALEVGCENRDTDTATRLTFCGITVDFVEVAGDAVPVCWSQYRRRHG
jgi:hypothetical protein